MKLVEIKNSLAKLYYNPSDFPLVLSDFLTIDDGNQKIISQVVSIESTNSRETNCAVLKFSIDIESSGGYSAYSGYVPPLDAEVAKTESQILNKIFSGNTDSFLIGTLVNTAKIDLTIKSKLLDNFLYIQSDRFEESEEIANKILEFNEDKSKTTLVIDTEGIESYKNAYLIELGKEFKLPVDNEVLNYIYENDLTGLTVEQKTIVQDIILEIQEYINSLESGFIPFNSLLEVVNDIYETDKSVGVILLRNKLLKYDQFNIFASTQEEIISLQKALEENVLTVLSVKNANVNWQKETLDFVLNTIKKDIYLILNINDEKIDKEIINKIYKLENINPIIFSRYDSAFASQFKCFAKNLILFKPEEQQRAFATYNSFLNKLTQKEFIISGDATFYTPLIVKEIAEKFEEKLEEKVEPNENLFVSAPIKTEELSEEKEVIEEAETEEPAENVSQVETIFEQDIEELQNEEIEELEDIAVFEDFEEESELKNIFEESLEEEIAKDVDQMFYAESPVQIEVDEIVTDEIETDEVASELIKVESETETEDEAEDDSDGINYDEMFSDEDLDLLDNLSEDNEFEEQDSINEEPVAVVDEEPFVIEVNESLPSIPIYKADLEENFKPDTTIKIAEGNIVYHEKYGRGVVEQLMNYGKKTLCSIQFDNVGRRLLDPNLADLKQM